MINTRVYWRDDSTAYTQFYDLGIPPFERKMYDEAYTKRKTCVN